MNEVLNTIESNELSPAASVSEVPAPSVPFSSEDDSAHTVLFSEEQFRAFLKSLSDKAGGYVEFAAQLGVSGQFLGAVVRGKEKPGKTILRRLGAKAVRYYAIQVEHTE